MTEAVAAPATDLQVCFAAVGIPQGVIVDPATGEAAGVVREAGGLRSMSRQEYGVWLSFLSPMPISTLRAMLPGSIESEVPSIVDQLEDRSLVVRIEPGHEMSAELSQLRPIPVGVALGNQTDPNRFEVRSSIFAEQPPVALDTVEVLFWWQFDGSVSLSQCATEVARRVPNLPSETVRILAARTAHRMMANRLIYLDNSTTES